MYFEDWELGMEWELAEVEITQEEMLEYANKYDIAPIHTDFEYGAKSRFGQIRADYRSGNLFRNEALVPLAGIPCSG